jgi:uncharacterized membrane protein YfcA
MPMDRALATSLVGIALISAAALVANLVTLETFPLALAAWFLLGGAVGMTAGVSLKSRLPAPMLKKIFAVAIVGVALWILGQSAFASLPQEPAAPPDDPEVLSSQQPNPTNP